MKKIASFEIDHLNLERGIYVSRRDDVNGTIVTTFDIRMKRPNFEPVLSSGAMHTIEHLGATFLRNHPDYKDDVIYFGPMGCRTGFYLILKGDYESGDIVPLVKAMFEFIESFDGVIPGATAKDCGNYLDHDLDSAKAEALEYLNKPLSNLKENNLIYP